MARAGTVCLESGCPEIAIHRGRCRDHAREHGRHQRATVPTKRLGNVAEERRRRSRAVAIHRARHGDWCPGRGRPPHPSTDLTAQHTAQLILGGREDQELEVLCRSCNSRDGVRARWESERRATARPPERPPLQNHPNG